jgi:GNAT superfamily N-acetyltransferase
MDEITLTRYVPGALGRITELHGRYYSEHWGLGLPFEVDIAAGLAEFFGRFDAARDGAWFAQADGEVVGGIFIDGSHADDEGARLRWFIIDPAYHGHGLGNRLMDVAMTFCREKGFPRVHLGTFGGLKAAVHLYEKHGFTLCDESDESHFPENLSLKMQTYQWLPAK